MSLPLFLNKLVVAPKRIFLVDGIGAFVSAISLGLILTRFERVFGMPIHVLNYLALAAVVFFFFSITCYLRLPRKWKLFLKTIAITNFTYCLITIFLVFKFHEQLTFWGHLYFILELMIIVALVNVEWRMARE